MSHGRTRQKVFHRTVYFEHYLEYLEESHKRIGIEIHSHCLMATTVTC